MRILKSHLFVTSFFFNFIFNQSLIQLSLILQIKDAITLKKKLRTKK
jgi:small basic protein